MTFLSCRSSQSRAPVARSALCRCHSRDSRPAAAVVLVVVFDCEPGTVLNPVSSAPDLASLAAEPCILRVDADVAPPFRPESCKAPAPAGRAAWHRWVEVKTTAIGGQNAAPSPLIAAPAPESSVPGQSPSEVHGRSGERMRSPLSRDRAARDQVARERVARERVARGRAARDQTSGGRG